MSLIAVVESNRCRRKRQIRAVTHAFALSFYKRVPTEGSSNGFSVSSDNPQSGLGYGHWSRKHSRKRLRLLASQRVNLQAVSQEQSRQVILATSPRKVALWKLKPDLMGAVVSREMAEDGGYHLLGLPYCLWTCKASKVIIGQQQLSRINHG
jgi:hypothetical protein